MSWPDRMRLLYRDFTSKKSMTEVNCIEASSDAQLDVLFQAMDLCTEAVVAEVTVERLKYPIDNESGATGAYATRRDMMRLNFSTAANDIVSISIAAPKVSNFKPDGETVDPLDGNVSDLITKLLARATSASGAALVNYRDGKRWYFSE